MSLTKTLKNLKKFIRITPCGCGIKKTRKRSYRGGFKYGYSAIKHSSKQRSYKNKSM